MGSSRAKPGSPPKKSGKPRHKHRPLDRDQRHRIETDLFRHVRAAQAERAAASNHRRDGEYDAAEAAEARAIAADTKAAGCRAVLARNPESPRRSFSK